MLRQGHAEALTMHPQTTLQRPQVRTLWPACRMFHLYSLTIPFRKAVRATLPARGTVHMSPDQIGRTLSSQNWMTCGETSMSADMQPWQGVQPSTRASRLRHIAPDRRLLSRQGHRYQPRPTHQVTQPAQRASGSAGSSSLCSNIGTAVMTWQGPSACSKQAQPADGRQKGSMYACLLTYTGWQVL